MSVDRCEFIRMDDPIYEARFPDFTLSVPHGREAYLEAHLRHFPREEAGLRRLAELCAQIFGELNAFPVKPNFSDLLMAPRRFPTVFRYRNATMSDVIDRELSDPRLKAVYATMWPWIGPPPRRASFLVWAVGMGAYVEDGAQYCRGSFQRLADALAAGLTAAGGELILRRRVSRLLMEGRRVRGTELDDGQQIQASVVISNIDPLETLRKVRGSDHVPGRYLRRLRRMERSLSSWVLYAVTDIDARALGGQHDTSVYADWDHERVYASSLAGEVQGLSVLIPTLKDASLAPPGEHLVILKTYAPAEATGAEAVSGDAADRMLELAEWVLPGLRHHLTSVEPRPGTESRAPLHLVGPMYGWAATPEQSGMRRLPQETPVAGLLLAGHWTRPGHSIWAVMRSGIGAARVVLGSSTSSPALPLRL
jgi:phytoene dehydrogenase-like protein